jgi:hypothetical protein
VLTQGTVPAWGSATTRNVGRRKTTESVFMFQDDWMYAAILKPCGRCISPQHQGNHGGDVKNLGVFGLYCLKGSRLRGPCPGLASIGGARAL